MNSRAIAAYIISNTLKGRSLTQSLSSYLAEKSEQNQLIQELSYGVMRWFWRLQFLVSQLITKPFKTKDNDVYALLLIGIYQMEFLDNIPDYAIVKETVAACESLKKPWAKNVVNAILRHYQRRREPLQAMIKNQAEAFYAHPQWLIDQLNHDWPQQWQQILHANNARAPMSLRVNLQKISREKYLQQLHQHSIEATPCPENLSGLTLHTPLSVNELPGFFEGLVSVQDNAAQLAAEILDARNGERILDACAAPGGKTCHILERTPAIQALTAIDKEEDRLAKVTENLKRLSLNATLVRNDASNVTAWWDGKSFDRILLDAPCSGTGVTRRHPDIKYLRKLDDIYNLVSEQQHLLNTLWPLLKKNGVLVYATCSVLPAENEFTIANFLKTHLDAREVPIETSWGIVRPHGRQIFPGIQGMDGFYYAKLVKI